jgi:preprotein translocase subunit SecF
MHILKYRYYYFILPAILFCAAVAAIIGFGLKPGVDLRGGTLLEISYSENRPGIEEADAALADLDFGDIRVQPSGEQGFIIRLREINVAEKDQIISALSFGQTVTEERFTTIGPTIGDELRAKGWIAIVLVALTVLIYIAFVFRSVRTAEESDESQDGGVPSWKYGLVAILTLLHDITIPAGLFAILGVTRGAEVDSLFIVAILTILGISINDTIVVFDRIRENIRRNKEEKRTETFEEVVGRSMDETTARSLNTSLTVVMALVVLYFVGPELTRNMALTLMVGMIAGTYSSLILASPLLVELEKWQGKKKTNNGGVPSVSKQGK